MKRNLKFIIAYFFKTLKSNKENKKLEEKKNSGLKIKRTVYPVKDYEKLSQAAKIKLIGDSFKNNNIKPSTYKICKN